MAEDEDKRLGVGGQILLEPLAQRGHDVAVRSHVAARRSSAIPVFIQHDEVGVAVIPRIRRLDTSGRTRAGNQLHDRSSHAVAGLKLGVAPGHRGGSSGHTRVVISHGGKPDGAGAKMGVDQAANGLWRLTGGIANVADGNLKGALPAGIRLHRVEDAAVDGGLHVDVARHGEVERRRRRSDSRATGEDAHEDRSKETRGQPSEMTGVLHKKWGSAEMTDACRRQWEPIRFPCGNLTRRPAAIDRNQARLFTGSWPLPAGP